MAIKDNLDTVSDKSDVKPKENLYLPYLYSKNEISTQIFDRDYN